MAHSNANFSNRDFAGYVVQRGGEQITCSAAIYNSRGQIPERDEAGRFLLQHGETFSLLLGNHTDRKVSMAITGDNESTVIATSLILSPNQVDGRLERWQTIDQAFVAFKRESEEGYAVGGGSVSEKGGGLIKIVFTIGIVPPAPQSLGYGMRGGGMFDGEPVMRFFEGYSKGVSSFDEGVMGAGGRTGQQFSSTSFEADETMAAIEIQLRWVIKRPQAPLDRQVTYAPSI